jgi:hypothetical protein
MTAGPATRQNTLFLQDMSSRLATTDAGARYRPVPAPGHAARFDPRIGRPSALRAIPAGVRFSRSGPGGFERRPSRVRVSIAFCILSDPGFASGRALPQVWLMRPRDEDGLAAADAAPSINPPPLAGIAADSTHAHDSGRLARPGT